MKKIKKQWIAALRSGEYRQTDGHLQDLNGFCCLGVLCDLHAKEHNKRWYKPKGFETRKYLKAEVYLPAEVCEWAGLKDACYPRGSFGSDVSLPDGGSLAMMNDCGKTFEQIADTIEEKF